MTKRVNVQVVRTKPDELIGLIIKFVTESVKDDFRVGSGRRIVLNAYNRYRDDECGGTGYIFQIHNQSDLKYLVDNNMMSAHGITFVTNNPTKFPDGMFTFDGEQDTGMQPVDNVSQILLDNLEDFVPFVILYACRCEEYKEFYERYITEGLEKAVYENM
jgi:hypothetical protein